VLKLLNLLQGSHTRSTSPIGSQPPQTNQEHLLCCPQHTDNTQHSLSCKRILSWAAYVLHTQAADRLFHPFMGPLMQATRVLHRAPTG
jgi:hypothetical protein